MGNLSNFWWQLQLVTVSICTLKTASNGWPPPICFDLQRRDFPGRRISNRTGSSTSSAKTSTPSRRSTRPTDTGELPGLPFTAKVRLYSALLCWLRLTYLDCISRRDHIVMDRAIASGACSHSFDSRGILMFISPLGRKVVGWNQPW